MIFLLLAVTLANATKFEPTQIARDLQLRTLQEIAKAKDSKNIQSLSAKVKSHGNLMRVCQIEVKEELNPQNCFRFIELWERVFNRTSPMRADLEEIRSAVLEKEAIDAYIQERSLAKSGTENE